MTGSRVESLGRIFVYGVYVYAAIVFTQAIRMVSLIYLHNYSPMGARPPALLQGSIVVAALIIAPIQMPLLVLGTLCLTRRRPVKRRRYVLLSAIMLCLLNFFIHPFVTWADYSTIMFFCTTIGFVPLAMLVMSVSLKWP